MQQAATETIRYLFDKAQANGAIREVVPGLHWLRLPLPFVLNHVNVWLLEDQGRWTIVDTGADRPETRAIWDTALAGRSVDRLIGTHGHPDHIGLAGWLVEKLNIPLSMTLGEWLAPQVWREEGLKPMRAEVEAFWRSAGVAEAALSDMKSARANAPFRNYPLPPNFERLRDGEPIRFGGRAWQVLVNGGHADEHASFYCSAEKILIAGDQVLSKISPVVGVFASQPKADPLADYLASLKRLATLPADTLVLPSHGLPFFGLHTRLQELEAHHHTRLDQLVGHMTAPMTAVALASRLFVKATADGHNVLATAETLAHAHRLVGEGRARQHRDGDGRVTFTGAER